MSENMSNSNSFREAVCIEAQRIFDSCSDKDCLEDLEVIFTDGSAKTIIDNATFIKCKCAEVINTYFTIEPVPFNKGFYSIDITYIFNVVVEAYTNGSSLPQTVSGTTRFCKKVILYGSEGNSRIFRSDEVVTSEPSGCCYLNLPTATVRVVEPIILDSKLVTKPNCGCHECYSPTQVDGTGLLSPQKKVFITVGLFSIVSLQRSVSILIPSYDYCVPHKDCSTTNDSPCELFEKIKFPTDEFFPLSLEEVESDQKDC